MNAKKLTKYPEGSILELLTISWPIMISSSAGCLMVVVDRIILSHYSELAFNACFTVIQWYWGFLFTLLEFALITEVFVGQYNGAQRYEEIGPATWQMIWFCLASYIIFIPLSLYGLPYLVADNIKELGVPYLKIITLFVPIDCIGYGALAAFFVGRGETRIISVVAILSNILNAILDYVLIFGIQWNGIQIIPEMGIVGAAIATACSITITTAILFILFLKKSHREIYKTLSCRLQPEFLGHCMKIAFPNALNRGINCTFWAIITNVLVSHVSVKDFAAFGISQSTYMLFLFGIEGISSGTRTICANAIGGRRFGVVRENVKAWIKCGIVLCLLICTILFCFPDYLIKMFTSEIAERNIVLSMLFWMLGMYVMDYIGFNLLSILIAAGDTCYTMTVNTISFLVCAVIPVCVGVIYFGQTSIIFWKFMLLDCCVRVVLFTKRYLTGRWMRHRII